VATVGSSLGARVKEYQREEGEEIERGGGMGGVVRRLK
jgi:hypothetical protein